MDKNYAALPSRFFSDLTAAALASCTISPIVAIIDSCVIKCTASPDGARMTRLLWEGIMPLFPSPYRFLTSRPTKLLFTVYFGTYATANVCDTLRETLPAEAYGPTSPTVVKLLSVSAVATGLTVWKDSRLTQMFGAVSKRPVPLPSYALFTIRDTLTIYACFVLPPILATRLDDLPLSWKQQFSLTSPEARTRISQLLLPVLLQPISTPIHLFALDLYNRQQRELSVSNRLARVGRDMPQAVPIRMLRILPAFGIGGLLNTDLRRTFHRTFPAGTFKATDL